METLLNSSSVDGGVSKLTTTASIHDTGIANALGANEGKSDHKNNPIHKPAPPIKAASAPYLFIRFHHNPNTNGAANPEANTPIAEEYKIVKSSGGSNAKIAEIAPKTTIAHLDIISVSYTHLDVYKRQVISGHFPLPEILPLLTALYCRLLLPSLFFDLHRNPYNPLP